MKHFIKFIFIQFFCLIMILSFILGIGAAESQMWGLAMILLFGPFGIGYIFNFNEMVHFCEVYERACSIKFKKSI